MTTTLTKPKEKTGQAFLIAPAARRRCCSCRSSSSTGAVHLLRRFLTCSRFPFYKMAHDCIRSGKIFWNWNTDLRANFIGSYSFTSWQPLLLADAALPQRGGAVSHGAVAHPEVRMRECVLLIRSCAHDSSGRLRGDRRPAYAFSGFSVYNVFFQPFP